MNGSRTAVKRSAVAAEQVPGDVGHLGVEELVHPAHVVDPHDLQRWLEQAGQPRQAMGDAGLQLDRVAVRPQRRSRDVVVQERVVVEKRIARRRAGQALQSVQRLLGQAKRDLVDRRS